MLAVDLNRTLVLDVGLSAGSIQQTIQVTAETPLLDPTFSGTGAVITPEQMENLPVNRGDYLDLVQLVPGVTINRAADEGSDLVTPILGERGGNAIHLVDGMPNRNEFGGGPSSQFNQNSILEFEVITDGYKAEFGHGSGGVINVVTRSGQGEWRGMAAVSRRDDALDSSNSLEDGQDPPELDFWDLALNAGGPILPDRVFMFASAEGIEEDRQLNFSFPPGDSAIRPRLRERIRPAHPPRADPAVREVRRTDRRPPPAHPVGQLHRGRHRRFPSPLHGHQLAVDPPHLRS